MTPWGRRNRRGHPRTVDPGRGGGQHALLDFSPQHARRPRTVTLSTRQLPTPLGGSRRGAVVVAVRVRAAVAILVALVVWLIAAMPGSAQVSTVPPPLRVWSAVSVGPLLERLADSWSDGTGIRFVTDATSRIVPQIAAGAPADVLVTADRTWMLEATDLGIVEPGSARRIARNRLVIFARAGSAGAPEPDRVEAGTTNAILDAAAVRALLKGVRGPDPILALAGPDVPVGRYAREALRSLGLEGDVDRRVVAVGNARAVVNAVAVGEVPLGLGYASDVAGDPALRIEGYLPADSYGPAEVWAAIVRGTGHTAAQAFVDELASASRAELIRSAGFTVPGPDVRLDAVDVGGPDVPARSPGAASVTPRRDRPRTDGIAEGPALGPVVLRSILVGLLAVMFATLPAVMLGRWLARTHSRARGPVGAVLLLPLVLPPVVTGFVLLALFGSSGLLGPLLAQFGVRLSFSFWAAVLAAAVVGFPLYAVVVRNAFESVDPRYEELAWTLGARPRSTFRRVALPLALPGVAAGAVLALARGLGEFGATIVVAGNIEGETQTLALAVYRLLESPEGRGRIWLFVLASAVIAVLGLALWEWLSTRQRARLLDGGGR